MSVTQDYKILTLTLSEWRAVQSALAVRSLHVARALQGETDPRYVEMLKGDLADLQSAADKVKA